MEIYEVNDLQYALDEIRERLVRIEETLEPLATMLVGPHQQAIPKDLGERLAKILIETDERLNKLGATLKKVSDSLGTD